MVETFTINDVFLVDWDSYEGVQDFPGGGRLIFFMRRFSLFWKDTYMYILKLAFSLDNALPCILRAALNCSLK